MAIKIEKGVPPPEPHGRGRPSKYPFGKRDVGDSFTISCGDARKACSAAAMFARAHEGYRFSSRSDSGVTRIWRIA